MITVPVAVLAKEPASVVVLVQRALSANQ